MAQEIRTHLTLQIPAITDGRCLGTIQDSLVEVDGVSNVQASVETKLVDLDIDPARVSAAEVETILAEAGYPAKS